MSDLVVESSVKPALEGDNVSADFYDALDETVAALLADATRRADADDRKTVQLRDRCAANHAGGANVRPGWCRARANLPWPVAERT